LSETSRDKNDRIIELLEELLKWTKVTAVPKVGEVLAACLPTDQAKLAYYYSDGRSSREVAQASRCAQSSIVGYWKKWSRNGIVQPVAVQRGDRYKKVFDPIDFGIEIPKATTPTQTPQSTTAQESGASGQ